MSDSNLLQAFNEGFQSIKEMFSTVDGKVDDLTSKLDEAHKQIEILEARLQKLEKKDNADSSNSHWPSSTDKIKHKKVIKSLREPSGKTVGGQPGHKGTTLTFSENPSKEILLVPHNCSDCGALLTDVQPEKTERRQVFDLPTPEMSVTEYQAPKIVCPVCGHINQEAFPKHVTQNVQYGPHMTALIAYLHHYQMIPFKRLSELTGDLFGHALSQGTLVSMIRRVSDALEPIESDIKNKLTHSKVVNLDETGCYVGTARWWLHVTSNLKYTFYHVDPSRGQEATERIGILPIFTGTGVHDNWGTYHKYDFTHALCNVHHLRELRSIAESFNQEWAVKMKELLLEAKVYSETHAYPLFPPVTQQFERQFAEIIELGKKENPTEKCDEFKDAQNLLWRFENRQEEILEFLYQKEVPFHNNQAERDCRMTKVKQKVSGTFRKPDGARQFARTRGFISTCQKQSLHILNSIHDALVGNPCLIQ